MKSSSGTCCLVVLRSLVRSSCRPHLASCSERAARGLLPYLFSFRDLARNCKYVMVIVKRTTLNILYSLQSGHFPPRRPLLRSLLLRLLMDSILSWNGAAQDSFIQDIDHTSILLVS
jgi:hypothetical protein